MVIPQRHLTGLLPIVRVCDKLNKVVSRVSHYCESKHTAKHVKPHKRKGVIERTSHFVDYAEVTVKGGNGGNGMMSFTSLPKVEWAGPDGGNGGNGGHVLFKAGHNVKSLSHLKPSIAAPRGVGGKTKQRDGKNAPHLTVEVPFGTVVKSKNGCLLTSLDKADDTFIAARGGAGGKGNYFFLSNENRAPTMAESGGLGQERQLHVELKIMAHAGLIGFPNAGKSSLLRAMSRAQPKVSPYPFTTLNPHIGMVLYDDHQQLAVADIPGLIPGSHLNKGMGHSFLRHIERCLCLIFVIDLALEKPWEQLLQLRYELNQYKPGLADRPSLLVANKIDLPGAEGRMDRVKEWMKNEILSEDRDREEVQRERGDVCEMGEFKGIDDFNLTRSHVSDIEQINLFGVNDIDNNGVTSLNTRVHCSDSSVNCSEDRKYEDWERGSEINRQVWEREGCGNNVTPIGGMKEAGKLKNGMLTLGVSAKREIGIDALVHHLRVIYDSHLSTGQGNKLR